MLFDVICRYPVRLWWVCLASDHIPDPRFCRNSWDYMPVLLQGFFFITSLGPSVYPLLVLLHVMSFKGYDITSHPLSINEATAFFRWRTRFCRFLNPEPSFGWRFFFIVWWLYLYYSKWPRYRWRISVNSGTQKSRLQTSPHYICFHYFDVPLLKTNTWHFHTSITFNYIQLLHTSTTQNTSTINTMKHFSDAGLKPLWQQGLASIALHAHPVVPQHRGKRPLARRRLGAAGRSWNNWNYKRIEKATKGNISTQKTDESFKRTSGKEEWNNGNYQQRYCEKISKPFAENMTKITVTSPASDPVLPFNPKENTGYSQWKCLRNATQMWM